MRSWHRIANVWKYLELWLCVSGCIVLTAYVGLGLRMIWDIIVTVSDVSSCRNFYIQFWTYICEIKTKATVNFVVSGDTEHHDDDDAPTVRWYLPHDPLHLSNRSTDYRVLRFTLHSSLLSPSLHLYFSLQHIVFPCCNVLHLKPAVFALYKLLYLHRLLYCICILQAAPHLRLCECVPS